MPLSQQHGLWEHTQRHHAAVASCRLVWVLIRPYGVATGGSATGDAMMQVIGPTFVSMFGPAIGAAESKRAQKGAHAFGGDCGLHLGILAAVDLSFYRMSCS